MPSSLCRPAVSPRCQWQVACTAACTYLPPSASLSSPLPPPPAASLWSSYPPEHAAHLSFGVHFVRSAAGPNSESGSAGSMYLRKVALRGFKSFAQPCEVQLCEGFTCITGANGSGKSNILDAICFAMTEDDLGKLRVRSYPELCSADRDVSSAHVLLSFSDGSLSSDNDFTVEGSVIKATGARTFKLNGIKKPIHHVRMLLKQRGIDLEASSCVLYQNTVVSLSAKSPKQLALMVMAASGGRVFDLQAAAALKNIDVARTERCACEAKIASFTASISGDEQQLGRLSALDELEERIQRAERSLAAEELRNIERQQREQHAKLEGLQKQYGEVAERQARREEQERHDQGAAQGSSAVLNIEAQLVDLRAQLKAKTADMQRAKEDRAELSEKLAQDRSVVAELEAEREDIAATLAALRRDRDVQSARKIEAWEEMEGHTADITRIEKTIKALTQAQDTGNNAAMAVSRMADLESLVSDQKQASKQRAEELLEAEQSLKKIHTQKKANEIQCQTQQRELEKLQQQVKLSSALAGSAGVQAEKALSQLERDCAQKRSALGALRSRLKQQHAARKTLHYDTSRGRASPLLHHIRFSPTALSPMVQQKHVAVDCNRINFVAELSTNTVH